MEKYYQNKLKFNGVYSRTKLFNIKDRAYIINLDNYESIGTHWIALFVNAENVTYSEIVLEFNIFQTKLENSLQMKILN